MALPTINVNPSSRSDAKLDKASTMTEISQKSEPIIPTSTVKLSAPLFKRKAKTSEESKGSDSQSTHVEKTNKEEVMNIDVLKRTSNSLLESSKVNKTEEMKNTGAPKRPSNPFCKSTV